MKYYNAMQAAKILNISDKTVRRYVAKGKLTAKRTEFNELAIPEDEVARLWTELNAVRAQFRQGEQDGLSIQSSMPSQSSQIIPLTDTTLTEAVKHIGKLAARVDIQQARIEELERRVAELEFPQSPKKPLTHTDDTSDVQPQQSPVIANVEAKRGTSIPADLPDGTLHSKEFGAQLGFTNPRFEGMLKNGVRGEQLERERIPTAIEGRYTNYFTPEQQEKAIALLKRHGKL